MGAEGSEGAAGAPLNAARRSGALDALRGLAALNVFFSHALFAWAPGVMRPLYPTAQAQFPAVPAWTEFAPNLLFNGYFGVALFFALSGHVLTEGSDEPERLRRRAAARYLRLMGPCLAATLIGWALMRLGVFHNIEAAALSGSTWLAPRYAFEPQFWHAVADGLWGAMVHGVDRYDPPLWSLRPEFLGSLILFGLLGCAGPRARLILTGPLVLLLFVLADPALAVLGSCLLLSGALQPLCARAPAWAGLTALGVGLVLANYAYLGPWGGLHGLLHPAAALLGVGDLSKEIANALAASLIVFGVARTAGAERWLTATPLPALGRHSYGIYLLHFPVICSLGCLVYLAVGGGGAGLAAAVAASAAVLVPVVWLFTRYVDLPSVALGNAFARWTLERALRPARGAPPRQAAVEPRPPMI